MSKLLPHDLLTAALRVVDIHVPDRPAWTCRECRAPWPCEDSRAALREQARTEPTHVRMYLAGQLVDACQDLPGVPGGELWRRMIGWL